MEHERTPWAVTDEEWCELCFSLINLGEIQGQFQSMLVDGERPSLYRVWTMVNTYQEQLQALAHYVNERIRIQARTAEHRG